MKRITICCTAIFAFAMLFAGEKVYLWPAGKMPDAQPHQIAAMTDEAGKPGFKADEHRAPYLEWFDPPAEEKRTGACMILISGGAYECLCDVGHIQNWTKMLTEAGIQCVNLVYRSPRPKGLPIYQTAWEDGQRAVRLVRNEAKKRGIDPERIGVMGQSAGSHLATLLATSSQTPAYAKVDELDEIPCHINWACTHSLAYGLTDGYGIPNSRMGDQPDVKLDSAFKFDAKTCPMWLSHGGADVYSPLASTQVYRQLRRMKIPAEVHLYPDKWHGVWGTARAIEFLRQMGFLGKTEPGVDVMTRYTAADKAATHSGKIPVWPEGKMPNASDKQCKPYIEWHIPKTLKTKAIQIAYSGGSYMGNDPNGFEVAPVRRYLNEKGMTVVTLKYRTPRPEGLAKHTTAWQDLQRAIRLVRAGAAERGLDPNRIGITGCSAGGHLTLIGATMSKTHAYNPIDDIDKQPLAVQWAIAIYPAYALTDGAEACNTNGGNGDTDRLVPEFAFDLDTPPILFIHGDADGWAAMNSVKTWEQLRRMGIQGELHTLAKRNHCFMAKATPGTGSYTYLDRFWEFLTAKGFNK